MLPRGVPSELQCPGHRNHCMGGVRKSHQCRNFFLQQSAIGPRRRQLVPGGARVVSCPGHAVAYAENFNGGFQSAKIFLCTKIESMVRKNIKQAAIQYVNVVKQL